MKAALVGVGIGLFAFGAGLAFAPKLVVNGQPVANGVVVSGGKTYVSLAALKAAGAEVSATSSTISVDFSPPAGRNQVDAVEGKLGYWLENNLWRVKVNSIEAAPNPFTKGPGFVAEIEFRNLGKKPISPFASGMDKLQVIDLQGRVVSFSQGTFKQFFRDVAPGGAITERIQFGDQQGVITELGAGDKLMIFFRTSGGKKAKDFRVFLREAQPGGAAR